jgi:hypothetical protein
VGHGQWLSRRPQASCRSKGERNLERLLGAGPVRACGRLGGAWREEPFWPGATGPVVHDQGPRRRPGWAAGLLAGGWAGPSGPAVDQAAGWRRGRSPGCWWAAEPGIPTSAAGQTARPVAQLGGRAGLCELAVVRLGVGSRDGLPGVRRSGCRSGCWPAAGPGSLVGCRSVAGPGSLGRLPVTTAEPARHGCGGQAASGAREPGMCWAGNGAAFPAGGFRPSRDLANRPLTWPGKPARDLARTA